jgi:hypothetical protein
MISLDALMDFPIRKDHYDKEHGNEHYIFGVEAVLEYAQNLPSVDAVPAGVYEQVAWERDLAVQQLKDYGVGLGQAKDLVEVTHCKDCKYGDWDSKPDDAMVCLRTNDGFWRASNDFCSRGEPKEETHEDH